VHEWHIPPSEFWAMTPAEWWVLYRHHSKIMELSKPKDYTPPGTRAKLTFDPDDMLEQLKQWQQEEAEAAKEKATA
jgi:hypothetical protein